MGFGVIADSPEGIHSRMHQIHHGTGLFGGAAGLFSGLDCAACGAPSCKALAEDIVRGYNTPDACVFLLKDKMKSLASSIAELEGKVPDTFKEGGRD